jgi:CSLREA domain-containing protein
MNTSAGIRVLLIALAAMVAMIPLQSSRAHAITFTVNSRGDEADAAEGDGVCEDATGNSTCTLRAAIQEANATGGDAPVLIAFDIAKGEKKVTAIVPATALPTLTRASVTIDGTTQPGSTCGSLWDGVVPTWSIRLDGASASFDGLTINAGAATVRGFDIEGFRNGLVLTNADNDVVQCNSFTSNSGDGLSIMGGGPVTIGGSTSGAGNVIGRNGGDGIIIVSTAATIQGNFIGTDGSGSVAAGNGLNGFGNGIYLNGANIAVGGTGIGAGNVVAANRPSDLLVEAGTTNVVIQGNYVGLDRTAAQPLYDRTNGGIYTDGIGTLIGGTAPGARNVVTAGHAPVYVGPSASNTVVQGNYINLDASGGTVVGHPFRGAAITDTGTNTTIGGSVTGAGNVISGQNDNGIGIELKATGATVQGNYIGTDRSGATSSASFGNTIGVAINGGDSNTVGGTSAAARNVISGNTYGVLIVDALSQASGNVVQGNYIGVAVDGTTVLGNGAFGVALVGAGTTNNTIGGIAPGAGNLIANSGAAGISTYDFVSPLTGLPSCSLGPAGTGNAILGNSIFNNGTLGIDLTPLCSPMPTEGVTVNDPGDTDTGPNDLQNFPELAAGVFPGGTSIDGTLNSTPSTTFRIEVFANDVCDSSGNGEGQTFVGANDSVSTNADGDATFTVTFAQPVAAGKVLTATATAPNGSTSEFSPCNVPPPTSTTTTTTTVSSTTTTSTTSSTTVTTSTTQATTSTAPPVGCATEPVAATFVSLECRLMALIGEVEAASDLGVLQAKLYDQLQKAKTHEEHAEIVCRKASNRRTRKALRPAINKLRRFVGTLRSREARSFPATIVDTLSAAAGAIHADMRALRRSLECPAKSASWWTRTPLGGFQ